MSVVAPVQCTALNPLERTNSDTTGGFTHRVDAGAVVAAASAATAPEAPRLAPKRFRARHYSTNVRHSFRERPTNLI
jgi:hypothetical protein